MKKKLVTMCLLMISVLGGKSQTYCYYCYGSVVEVNGQSYSKYYNYDDFCFKITFQGDSLNSMIYFPASAASDGKSVWRTENRGIEKMYYEYQKNIFGSWKLVKRIDGFDHFYVVSSDKSVVKYFVSSNSSPLTVYYYKRCPDENCDNKR